MWGNGMMASHGWDAAWPWMMGLHFVVWLVLLVLLGVGVAALVRLAWPPRQH